MRHPSYFALHDLMLVIGASTIPLHTDAVYRGDEERLMTSVRELPEREMIEGCGRAVVAEIVPEELDTFDVVAEAFFDQGRSLPTHRRIDDRLGVGVDLADLAIAATPVVLMIANEAAKAVVGEATKTSIKALGRRVGTWRRRRRHEAPAAEASTDPARDERRARLIGLALAEGMTADVAARVVDAVLEQVDRDRSTGE